MFHPIRRLMRHLTPGTALGATALVVALGGAAYAAIPGADGTISGCYATTDGLLLGIPHSKGDLRAVDAGEACRSYEKALSWSQRGGAGPVAYARLRLPSKTTGVVDPERSMGVTDANVSGGSESSTPDRHSFLYCLGGLAAPKIITATAEAAGANDDVPTAAVLRVKPASCPDPNFSFAVLVTAPASVPLSAVDVVLY